MKICENGTIRDMTAAEIAAIQAATPDTAPEPLTEAKKLELFLAAIPEEPMPEADPKLGYKWQPMYSSAAGFAWELVEDPTALGTQKNPRYWVPGMAVKLGHFYTTDGATLYLAIADGVPEGITDTGYLEPCD